jgi:hypothetical protein
MAFVTGDVVPVEGEEHPYKVVFKHGEAVIAEWLVESVEDGQAEILEALRGLVDDDDEPGDDDDDNDDDKDGKD